MSWFRASIDHNLVPHNRWILTTLVGFFLYYYQTTRPGEMGIPQIGRTIGQLRPSAPNADWSRGKFWRRCLKWGRSKFKICSNITFFVMWLRYEKGLFWYSLPTDLFSKQVLWENSAAASGKSKKSAFGRSKRKDKIYNLFVLFITCMKLIYKKKKKSQ